MADDLDRERVKVGACVSVSKGLVYLEGAVFAKLVTGFAALCKQLRNSMAHRITGSFVLSPSPGAEDVGSNESDNAVLGISAPVL